MRTIEKVCFFWSSISAGSLCMWRKVWLLVFWKSPWVTWQVHFHLIHLNLIGHAVDRTATPHNPGHVIPQKAYNGVKGIWYVYMFLQHVAFNILQSWWVSHWPKRPFPWTRGPFGQIATPGRLLEHLERCALVGTCWEWRWSFLFLGKPMVEFRRHLFWEAPI